MTIDIFTCFTKMLEPNMKFGIYLILRGLIFGGLISGGNFVLVSKGAHILRVYIRHFRVLVPGFTRWVRLSISASFIISFPKFLHDVGRYCGLLDNL